VPRCGALSLLQKTTRYRGGVGETAATLYVQLCDLRGGGGGGGGRGLRLFSPILISNPFEISITIMNLRLKNPSREF
jgi:hypothetical protein